MRTDVDRIAAQARVVLATRLRLAVAERPAHPLEMSPAERQRHAALRGTPRARPWQVGRAALKRLLRELGRSTDTAELRFPNATCSLSHTSHLAVAAGSDVRLSGIGVDIELRPQLRLASARFFLKQREQEWLTRSAVAAPEWQLLRLWTVKEAAFKADPDNEGALLVDYDVERPQLRCGIVRSPAGRALTVASWPFGSGFLSLAIAKPRRS